MAFAPLPSAPVWKYEMFLSFSGKDTRKGIVSTLYHELKKLSNFNPFMDSQELKPGAEISSDLLTAIQESKSVIIFLSPNYASSAWCLDELEIIVQCLETKNTKVIPIFYNVDPSDVRHQLRTFAEAFTRHEHRYSQEDGIRKVKRWRTALTKVANLSGLESSKFESDIKLVHHILELVRSNLITQLTNSIPEPSSQWKHDVFLSFIGEDTKGLISILADQLQTTRGITIFKDDGHRKEWINISRKLQTAIEESRLAIVVLTPNYAFSTWCLDVLAKIFQVMKDKSRILPLFYKVDTSDVRNQKGSFEEAFTTHEKKSRHKVKQWRLGLKKVSNLTMWDLNNYESETKLVEHMLEVVWSKVQEDEKAERSTGYIEAFEPRKRTVHKIMEMLQHDEVAIIGVCGMRGVGKTSMVKYVGAQAQRNRLFDHVIMSVVSQNPNLRKLQGTLADLLGLKLPEETECRRAGRLHERIMSGNRILIILDGTWGREDLSSIGIPGRKELLRRNSKVLITSRIATVCHSMGCQTTIHLNALSEENSWNLFLKEGRTSFDKLTDDFVDVAWRVVRACAGLPIALIAVARALPPLRYNTDLSSWNEAALQLTSYLSSYSPDLDYDAILLKCMKLSYHFLGSNDAKSCFLLCCLFPNGYNIRIEDLVRYGIGKGLFQDSNIKNARARVHLGVKYLKDVGLLLDTERDECVRMNDYMADMYLSISSLDDGLKFLVNGDSENKSGEGYNATLLMKHRGGDLPSDLVYPNLLILLLQYMDMSKMPSNIFANLNALRVFDLSFTNISLLPVSFSLLTNLETLNLDYCDQLTDVSVLGNMKKLQILSMREVPVEELPKEIGNLKDLRMLDMSGSYNISAFPFKLLSRLHKLEELHMQCNFGEERSKAVVKEEEDNVRSDGEPCWRNLDIMELCISNSNCLPKYVEFNPCWVNFDICISRYLPARKSTLNHDKLPYSRVLTLDTTINSLPDWFINVVVPDTEKLEFIECKGLNNILVEYDHGRFVELKYLAVAGRHENLEALMNTITWVPKQPVFESLEELHLCEVDCLKVLCVGKLPPGSLCNLKVLVVTSCMKLKSLFTWDVAQCLSQLEDLSIIQCPSLERVIEASEETLKKKKIAFPELKNLVLSNLPQLAWFYSTGSAIIECLALEHLHVQDCPQFSASTSDFHSWNQVRINDLRHLRSNNDEMSDVTSGLNEECGTSLTPEDTVESLSPNARQHIEILRELQCQRDELEAKFLQERAALEAKFQQVVSTLIQSRAYESA